MRQTDDQSDFALSKTLYDKCKTLLALNFEQDPLNLLKAISMLSIWMGRGTGLAWRSGLPSS